MQLPAPLADEVVAHAREDFPDECCGLIATRDGEPVEVLRVENLAHSPLRFEVDGLTLFKAIDDFEQRGLELGAIYHSHTRTPPYPSQTDVNFSRHWPGVAWVIVGLERADGEPTIRSYLIADGQIDEQHA